MLQSEQVISLTLMTFGSARKKDGQAVVRPKDSTLGSVKLQLNQFTEAINQAIIAVGQNRSSFFNRVNFR